MEQLVITGGNKLTGSVEISGAKNAALPILVASILADDTSLIDNIPEIQDIKNLIETLEKIGVSCNKIKENTFEFDCSNITTQSATYDKVKKIRASYYLLGAMLGRFKKAVVAMPGGCNIGDRPIDQHIKGFEALGATVTMEHGMITVEADKLVGTNIYLDIISVGATINVMLAAVLAEGTTVIENCAKEPHIVDVANFLNKLGANIKGAGTDTIKINGVEKLTGTEYSIIPDQIEAGTYLIAGAITKGDVTVKNVIPKHLDSITMKLKEMGYSIEEFSDSVRVYIEDNKTIKPCNVKTMAYPGFPTDMQPQMVALLSVTNGNSKMNETVWDSRYQYVTELKRLGADISTNGSIAHITGVNQLSGAEVTSTDLRAGAALFLAGLVADGETYINKVDYIDRGYEKLEEKLTNIGAVVKRINIKG